MSRPSERNAMPLVAVLLASFGAHLLLWPLGDEVLGMTWTGRTLPRTEGAMEVALLEPDEIEEPDPDDPDAPPPAEPPGKLVQLDRVDEERAPERETPYVSEFDNRANAPTRAPNVRPQPGAPAQPRGDRDDGRKGQGESPDPSEPHALPLMPTRETPGDDSTDPDERGELS
ncbi:MAG: hypothetical protein IAG13_04200, partial [Deltaproteobacteria bacterium]|nr:hypothetical protein [Nannocystaceae bacterium]